MLSSLAMRMASPSTINSSLVAQGLLVKPVTEKGATEVSVYLPAEEQPYYDYFNHRVYRSTSKGKNVAIPAALDQIPLLIRGGSIIPTRERPRRSSPLMKNDPFTLRIALDKTSNARGELYIDDGVSYNHEQGQIVWREFKAAKAGKGIKISSHDLVKAKPSDAVDGVALTQYNSANEFAKSIAHVRVEKVVVLGLEKKPSSVKVAGGQEVEFDFIPGEAASGKKEGTSSVLIIKDPKVAVVTDWEIIVS
ncbi:hypothetical protein QCA50_004698 [Cerrena zonata]|uniref:DUF5110 domain-containing protein n=1 Tax=Cerrena zonata TaxID=2478898 RepID=A0AAW0GHP3_9APHY